MHRLPDLRGELLIQLHRDGEDARRKEAESQNQSQGMLWLRRMRRHVPGKGDKVRPDTAATHIPPAEAAPLRAPTPLK